MQLYKVYRAVSKMLSPFIMAYFYLRCALGKDEKQSVKNHFGKATIARPEGNVIWIHAASIGEATSAVTYIKHFRLKHDDPILLTTMTLTSARLLKDELGSIPNCYHQFVVADVPEWINEFLDYWSFSKVIFLESEIWPNIIHAISERNIPLYLLNARLSDGSYKLWNLAGGFLADLLQRFTKVLAQSSIDAERFSSFYPDNVVEIDNLKYANDPLPCKEGLYQVFKSFCSGRNVFVAASTHEGEEEIILKAHKMLNAAIPVCTIIIPRHINRVRKIADCCDSMGVLYSIKSEAVNGKINSTDLFIVDSYGEVGTFYRLADVTFVGGSLVPTGGHNIFEPAILGKPVLHGPHMNNFVKLTELLHQHNVAFEVKNEYDIAQVCLDYFTHPEKLKGVMDRVKDFENKSLKQIEAVIG